jgi:cytolysin (calcineurin-like family phosphatase)
MRIKCFALVAAAVIIGIAGAALGRDITFFVASDLHYGQDQTESNEQPNKNAIAIMNNLPGVAFPEKSFGVVEKPRGVLITGDLTDSGTSINYDGIYLGIHVYDGFIDDYPVKGGVGAHMHYPVYEGYGNHDVQKQTGDAVLKGIISRNANRGTAVNVSDNGLHYSWDWDDAHFINVNVYAGGAGDARESLSFLQKDLAARVGTSGRPVVIMQHYGFDKSSTEDRWWKQEDRDAFYNVVKKYYIAAIFSGHQHSGQRIIWHGIVNFVAPRAKGENSLGGIYAVRMLDKMMIVAQRCYDRKWGDVWTENLPAPLH